MFFDDGKARLTHASRKLQQRWEQTLMQWNDQVTRDFDRRHLQPLEPKLADSVRAINRLAEIFARAKRECS